MSNCIIGTSLVKDGTYTLVEGELVNYADKWAYGYIVGVPGRGNIMRNTPIEEAGLIQSATVHGWHLFGVWTDPNSTLVYIDPVEHIGTLAEALAAARERGELAIWSLFDSEEVWVS